MTLHMNDVRVGGQNVETGIFALVLLGSSSFCRPQRTESPLSGGDRFPDSENTRSSVIQVVLHADYQVAAGIG